MGFFVDKDGNLSVLRAIGSIILFVFIIISLLSTIAIVPAGYRGVVLQFGAVEDRVLVEGLHFLVPFVESYRNMEVRTQKYEVNCESASQDLMDVKTTVAINYHIDPASVNTIYQKLSENYQERVIAPQVQEVVKAVTAKYNAEGLIQTRESVKRNIDELLTERMLDRNIIVETISITNFVFPPEFNNAITAKQTRIQTALEAENKVKEAEAIAKQIVATAQGQAESIRLINEQLKQSPDYLKLKALEKWNGILPTVILGTGAVPFISLDEFAKLDSEGG
jgi:regulator of protease activity HflC (stomatin/prohibitin superfamily)